MGCKNYFTELEIKEFWSRWCLSYFLIIINQKLTNNQNSTLTNTVNNMEFDHILWVIDQEWCQDGWILAKFFLVCWWTEMELTPQTCNKRTTSISSHLAQTSLVNWGFTINYGKRKLFPCRTKWIILGGHLLTEVTNYSTACPLMELAIIEKQFYHWSGKGQARKIFD